MKRLLSKRITVLTALVVAAAILTGCASTSERAQKAAVGYLEEEKYEKAIEELTTVITKAHLDKAEEVALMINGYYLRGDCYAILGDEEKAQADYAKALEEDLRERDVTVPMTATRYLRRGLVYLERGDYASALDAFKAGLASGDHSCDKELLRNEICCYERLNEFDMASTEAEKYANAYPEDTEMVNEYKFLISRQTEAQNARDLLAEPVPEPETDEEDEEETY